MRTRRPMRMFAVKARIRRQQIGWSKLETAMLLGMKPRAYESFEEGQHAPLAKALLQVERGLKLQFFPEDIDTVLTQKQIKSLFGDVP